MTRDLESAVAPVADAFDALGVEYYLAGSVISSLFGIARATADVDVVAQLRLEHVKPLVERLVETYYIDEDVVIDATRRGSMFNVIHSPRFSRSMSTLRRPHSIARRCRDGSVIPSCPTHQRAISRSRQRRMLFGTSCVGFATVGRCQLASGPTSWACSAFKGRAWTSHVRQWAALLGIEDLFERAWSQAGA